MLNSSRFSLRKYTENTVKFVSREIRLGIFSRSWSRSSTELTSRASSARIASNSASDADAAELLSGRAVSTWAQSVLRHPVVGPLHSVLLVVVLLDAVAFARIKHQLGRLAAILQAAIQLVGLTYRYALVVGAVQDRRRRRHLVDVRHRRAIEIERQRLLVRNAAKVGDQHARDVV